MKKKDLVADVADKLKIPRARADQYVTATLSAIKEALLQGDQVLLTGLGVLDSKFYAERESKMPFHGGRIVKVGARRRLHIRTHDKCSDELVDALDKERLGL